MAADLAIKEPVRAATTGNITLSGLQTIDGIALSSGDRVLVRAQSTATQNGLYTAASGSWTRATDFDGAGEVTGGTQVYVQEGSTLGDIAWRVAGDAPVTPGSSTITFEPEFLQTGSNAVPRSLQARAREMVSVSDFGAKGDGVADDTAALLAFFTACIADSRDGFIPAGTYRVEVGQLLFDNNNVRTAWPNIYTAGAEAVTFLGTTTADAPIIEFRNGTYVSGPQDNYWIGGCLGGLSFEFETPTVGADRHGIKAYGLYGTHFGRMIGTDLDGSTFHFTVKKFTGNNPDPYAVGSCVFEGIEGYGNTGRAVDNQNDVGLNFCIFPSIRGTNNVAGVLYGLGAANTFTNISAGACAGWAIDSNVVADGRLDRSIVEYAEIDSCEYGINLVYVGNVSVEKIRFVHRYQSGPDDYWPRICLNLADDAGSVVDCNIDTIHRIEPGGDKVDLGVFLDCNNNGNIGNTYVDQRVNATTTGFTFTNSELYTAVNANAQIKLLRDGVPILDQMPAGIPVGYRTTDGGTVTQLTSRTTAVTLNKPAGRITLVSAAGSATPATFTVNNSLVTTADTVLVNQFSGNDIYIVAVRAFAGGFNITSYTTGGTTTEQPTFNFTLWKGSTV